MEGVGAEVPEADRQVLSGEAVAEEDVVTDHHRPQGPGVAMSGALVRVLEPVAHRLEGGQRALAVSRTHPAVTSEALEAVAGSRSSRLAPRRSAREDIFVSRTGSWL